MKGLVSTIDIRPQYNGDEQFDNSRWDVPKEQGEEFAKTTVEFLSDEGFRGYIESKLDEDRMAGEWENTKRRRRIP